tara:strand:- start:319922 stop:320440 length:519 start_codon:yes stop_codon:yes gene_type:complete
MKTSKLKITITIFSMLLCFGMFAQRPQGGQGGKRGGGQQRGGQPDASVIMSMLDTNKDEKIDRDEASKDKRGRIEENFNSIDTNDDQYIDLNELKASLNIKAPKKDSAENVLKEVDDNKDGSLNKLEIAAKEKLDLINNFSTIDVNKDNELDLEELTTFYAKSKKSKRKKRN